MYLNFTKYKDYNFQYIMKTDNTQEEMKILQLVCTVKLHVN